MPVLSLGRQRKGGNGEKGKFSRGDGSRDGAQGMKDGSVKRERKSKLWVSVVGDFLELLGLLYTAHFLGNSIQRNKRKACPE